MVAVSVGWAAQFTLSFGDARTRMTPKQAIAFVKANGVVLESGRGPVPNLAEAIAGAAIRGS